MVCGLELLKKKEDKGEKIFQVLVLVWEMLQSTARMDDHCKGGLLLSDGREILNF